MEKVEKNTNTPAAIICDYHHILKHWKNKTEKNFPLVWVYFSSFQKEKILPGASKLHTVLL